jgi:alkylhydroperoxidase family enzyme
MPALDSVEWESCLLEPLPNPAAERRVRRALGMVPPGARYFIDSEWFADAVIAFDIPHLQLQYVSSDLSEMTALVVSQDGACRYCFSATRGVLGILGFSDARIQRLEGDLLAGDLPAADRLALQLARRVSRSVPPARAADATPLLEAGWSIPAVQELVALVAVNVFFNRTSTLAALPYEAIERYFARPTMRLLRPLVRRMVRPRRVSQPLPLTAAERQGAFAEQINAFDGVPLAKRLRAAIDACLRGSSLGPRATALVFAVVGRGIGCALTEREATRMLCASGFPAEEVEPALAHLAAPSLGAVERAAATLARDSIWPQPAALQRQARAVREQLTRTQFIDLIGTASLANALCRLGIGVELAARGC